MTVTQSAGDRPERIPLLGSEGLTPEQRRVYDMVVAGPRGSVVGPLRAALHNADLAERWSNLGEQLRYRTSLSLRQSELVIIVVARHWNSDTEWAIHSEVACEAGLAPDVIEAIRHARPPAFEDPIEGLIYEFTRQLLACGTVSDDAYSHLYAELGEIRMVELTALVGYYTMVAMSLNAHHIPKPVGVWSELPEPADNARMVTVLPPAQVPLQSAPKTRSAVDPLRGDGRERPR
jgi:4-carboxymuconolactone decarboxylase